eukprot:m.112477 g.112477  ORF g.112477 m.112477 type:complete len:221 (-) comp15327_c2_seq1:214-876(-)
MASKDTEHEKKPSGFSFFASAEDIDLSDSDEETDEVDQQKETTETSEEHAAKKSKSEALPSLDELLSDKKLARPTFLENQLTAKDLATFDRRAPEQPRTPWVKMPGEKTAAEAQKKEEKKQADRAAKANPVASQVMAAATAFSKMYKTEGFEITEAMLARQQAAEEAKARQAEQNDPSKSFKAKEQRKRDIGQTSREKSWVEEEKRKLKETSSHVGYGFD